MHTYDVDLFLKLAEVFPAALNTSRVYDKIESSAQSFTTSIADIEPKRPRGRPPGIASRR